MKEETARLILDQTKENYNLIAQSFSQTRNHLWPDFDYFKKYLKAGDRVLDIGCGNGRLYEFIKDNNIGYRGQDISPSLIKEAKKKYPEIADSFSVGDILDLKENVDSLDKIFCLAVLHHLPSNNLRLQALRNLRQVLRPGGLLFLTCWNLWNNKYLSYIIKYSWQKFFPQVISDDLKTNQLDFGDVFIPWKKDFSHQPIMRYYHAFTLSELARLVKASNLKIVVQFYSKDGQISSRFKAHNLIIIAEK